MKKCEMQIQCRHETSELRTACSRCCAKRKCNIINIKTTCFHSIRFSLKTFDKVEWTTGGLQLMSVCREKNKSKHE